MPLFETSRFSNTSTHLLSRGTSFVICKALPMSSFLTLVTLACSSTSLLYTDLFTLKRTGPLPWQKLWTRLIIGRRKRTRGLRWLSITSSLPSLWLLLGVPVLEQSGQSSEMCIEASTLSTALKLEGGWSSREWNSKPAIDSYVVTSAGSSSYTKQTPFDCLYCLF